MKKFVLLISFLFLIATPCFASNEYLAFAENNSSKTFNTINKEVRKTLKEHIKVSNEYKIDEMMAFYDDTYMNTDGFSKEVYSDLVKQTWKLYPDIKYSMKINAITIIGNTAIVDAEEIATASTMEEVEDRKICGQLKSKSSSIYYLEKFGNEWKFVSDHIVAEKTTLTYGEAALLAIELITPQMIPHNTEYTASLNVKVPDKNMLVIASIAQEKVTYPQINAPEVFRKLPENGILERLFKSNNENKNEYTVASLGITRAKMNQNKEIKIYVTGLGYIITRTNVIPDKKISKKVENDKEKIKSN